jgi:predicted  nucleic acid-binding Zn-ribbon protein
MAEAKTKIEETLEISIEAKLRALFELQLVDTETDKIKILRGELPLEVQDLEDDIAGLETRIHNFLEEVKSLEHNIANKKLDIVNSEALIKKYEEQQKNVRNNREFDSLSKEMEFQNLEIELARKKISEFNAELNSRKEQIVESTEILDERKDDLESKKNELEEIVSDTKKEEETLFNKSATIQKIIEPRLLSAYKRIRGNARNGLAVVSVERDACGGCFNKIPPQHQLDIRMHKKIIVCEYCGRILVDDGIVNAMH